MCFCGILLFACKSKKEVMEVKADAVKYSYSTGPCFGKCAVLKMDVYDSGKAVIYGRQNTKYLGEWSKQVSEDKMTLLDRAFKEANFPTLEDSYPSQIPDLPYIRITCVTDGIAKVVGGREDRPAKVVACEILLKEIIAEDNWTLIKAAELDEEMVGEKPEINDGQIIIKPAVGVRLALWLKKNKEPYGIRLIDRISAEDNYWLITYDKSKISAEDVLPLLEKDKEIESAKFNLEVENR